MKTFNKNWFLTAILIIIFFILGFLVGKTCNNSKSCHKKDYHWKMKGDGHHGMMKHKKVYMMKGDEVLHEIEEMGDSVEVKVEVKKKKKN